MTSQQYQALPQQPANRTPSSDRHANIEGSEWSGDTERHGDIQRRPATPNTKDTEAQAKEINQAPFFEDAFLDIFSAASLVTFPMLILSGVSIGLVLRWQVSIPAVSRLVGDPGLFSDSLGLINNTQSLTNSYFIDIEATTLVTIAFWTSTVGTGRIAEFSNKGLPTLYQLWMLINLFTGSYASLWSWAKYRFGPSRPAKRDHSQTVLTLTTAALTSTLVLGLLILLADTWLYLTTTTVILQEIQQTEGALTNFSRVLSPSCQNQDSSLYSQPCTISANTPLNGGTEVALENPAQAYRTLFDIANETKVLSTESEDILYSFYASASIPQKIEYRASAVGMSTVCSPITQARNLEAQFTSFGSIADPVIWSMNYQCSLNLSGDLLQASPPQSYYSTATPNSFFLEYFNDTDLMQPNNPAHDLFVSRGSDSLVDEDYPTYFTRTAPAIFVVGALITAYSESISSSPEVVEPDNGAQNTAGFLLKCSLRVVQTGYSFLNGSFKDIVTILASENTVRAVTNPSLVTNSTQVLNSLTTGLQRSALQYNMNDLVASFAQTYSHAVLSLGVGAVVPAPALQQSTISERQITRMPKAPFYTLLGLNFLYVILGIVLAVVAFASKPLAVEPIQARLSGPALVAALFEGDRAEKNVTSLYQLFEENEPGTAKSTSVARVALVPTTLGGLKFEKIRL